MNLPRPKKIGIVSPGCPNVLVDSESIALYSCAKAVLPVLSLVISMSIPKMLFFTALLGGLQSAAEEYVLRIEEKEEQNSVNVAAFLPTDQHIYMILEKRPSYLPENETQFILESRPTGAEDSLHWSQNLNKLPGITGALNSVEYVSSAYPIWRIAHHNDNIIVLFDRAGLLEGQEHEDSLIYRLDQKGNLVTYSQIGLGGELTTPQTGNYVTDLFVGSNLIIVVHGTSISILDSTSLRTLHNLSILDKEYQSKLIELELFGDSTWTLTSSLIGDELFVVGATMYMETNVEMPQSVSVWIKKFRASPKIELITETNTDIISNFYATGKFDLLVRDDSLVLANIHYPWERKICEFSRETLGLISCTEVRPPRGFAEDVAESWERCRPTVIEVPGGYTWITCSGYEGSVTRKHYLDAFIVTRLKGTITFNDLKTELGLDADALIGSSTSTSASQDTIFVWVSIGAKSDGGTYSYRQELHKIPRQIMPPSRQAPALTQ